MASRGTTSLESLLIRGLRKEGMWGGNEELVQKHYALINITVQKNH